MPASVKCYVEKTGERKSSQISGQDYFENEKKWVALFCPVNFTFHFFFKKKLSIPPPPPLGARQESLHL